MGTDEVWELDATAQAARIAAGDIGPHDAVEEALERIDRIDPEINSVVCTFPERTSAEHVEAAIARGAPFAGVPTLLKDAGQELAGTRYGVGLSVLHDIEHRSTRTTPFAEHLERLGFVIIGKCASAELATGNTTEPPGLDPTRNPWDLERTVGGSSGGTAASVAAGLVPVAHGSDHTGSLRYPASACGAVTLKPTKGRVESTGVGDIVTTFAANMDFVIARSVRDLAGVLPCAIAPAKERAVRLLDVSQHAQPHLDPACRAAVERAGEAAESLGHDVDVVSLPELEALRDLMVDFDLVTGWLRARTKEWLTVVLGREVVPSDMPAELYEVALSGASVTDAEADEAGHRIRSALDPYVTAMRTIDVLITPTLLQPAWHLGIEKSARNSGAFPVPSSITGQPAMSIPLHHDADRNLPVGVHLVGNLGSDEQLLSFASELEEHSSWAGRWPELAKE